MNFREMQKAVHENSVNHGFWEGYVSPHDATNQAYRDERNDERPVLLRHPYENRLVPTKLALIHSEVSEALECYRNGELEERADDCGCGHALRRHEEQRAFCRGDEGGDRCPCTVFVAKPCGLSSELADVVIHVMDLAEALGIDLESAIERKHAYNLTRPYKHGGEAI